MKHFKIFLVETLIQLTILTSISRYHHHHQNSDHDPYQELLQKSLLDFERHNFISTKGFDFNHQFDKEFFDFENSLALDKGNNYLRDILRNQLHRQQSYQVYLNPTNYLRVTDKFLEYPELQTKHSLVSFCNNANISPEDMDAIKKILFDQDADVGVDRAWYDPEYRTAQFEKNYTNNNKNDLDYLLQSSKPTIVFKEPRVGFEEVFPVPDGYQKVVEEDTGEVFFIPTEEPMKTNLPVEIIEPKLMPDMNGFFNQMNLDKLASTKDDFLLDDMMFFNGSPSDVKLDEDWLKNFMEPTPTLQTPGAENVDMLNSLADKNNVTLVIQEPSVEETFNLNVSDISAVNNDEVTYFNSMNELIDNMLANKTNLNDNSIVTEQLELFINNDDFYNLDDFDNFDFTTTTNLNEKQIDQNSSTILSDTSSDSGFNSENGQMMFKEEITSQDALYGVMHNHTYLESNNDDVIYHPHSYKNKLKNLMNATNRESKDESLLSEYRIPYSLDLIVNSNVDTFTELLKDPKLTNEQLNIMRDIRRRGKNKIAAKTCRKRKIDSIDNLKEDVDELRLKKKKLEMEREKIQEQIKQFATRIDGIYKDLTGSNRDPSDPIKNYIENLLKQLNETSDVKSKSDKTPKNNKRK